jgi:DNA-binding transcriptional LysR family regulator
VADNWTVVHEAAKAGLGIARMLCISPINKETEQLEPIFSDLAISNRSVWAVIPRMRPVPRKIDTFLSFLSKALQQPTIV